MATTQTTEHEVAIRLCFEGQTVSGEMRVGDAHEPRPFASWLGLLSLLEALEPQRPA